MVPWMYALLSLLVGTAAGFGIRAFLGRRHLGSAENRARRMIEDAEKEIQNRRKEMELELKDRILRERTEFERELRERRGELQAAERRILQKEENLDRKAQDLEKKESAVLKTERELEQKIQELERLREAYAKELEHLAGLTREEARTMFLKTVEDESRLEAARLREAIEEEARRDAEKKAREIVAVAIQRNAFDYVSEMTVTTIPLPSDEMKGRIIGREGRNIRSLEQETGVDFIIDDTPEAVVISSFDPIRREVAKLALEKLLADGRIHPAHIEEVVKKSRREVELAIKEEGEKTVFEFGLLGVHPDLAEYLGKLKFRTSYGQNILEHSREVARIAGTIAELLGEDRKAAVRAGLFHDIGKAVSFEQGMEGPHALVGAELLRKYNEPPEIVEAIAAHHGETESQPLLAVIIAAADAISAARPGARQESIEHYIKRLQDLERLADSFPGVEKSYAIQAGREVRVIVKNDQVDDERARILAREIAERIQKELDFPGQIKVTLIRETRVVEYAK